MSNYKRKEILDYLTRKPSTTEDIELARTRIQIPVTPLPMQDASNEDLGFAIGGRVEFQKAGLAIAAKFTQKQIDSPITGEAAKLEGNDLMKWIKKQYNSKNYNDINFYKAIEKYKNEELGGNLFRFWEESGLSRNNIEKSLARTRNFKFTTLGKGLNSEIEKNIDVPFKTVREMTDAIKKGEFNVQDRINSLTKKGIIEKDKFYNSYDLTKILGVAPDKEQVDNITQLFTVGKKGAYQKGIRGGEDIPFEQAERKNIFKYRPEDVAANIQKFGEEKTIFGTGNQAAAARRKLEMEIDPEFVNYKENFKTRRSTLLNSEHPDFVEIALKRNVDSGLNYDIGHPVALGLIAKHDFLQTPKNIKKFHSISDFTIQDERINRKIIVGKDEAKEISKKYRVGFQAEEDRLLIELGNFLKNKEGKKATQEDINFINQWNKKFKELYKEKFETVKSFVNDYKDAEPYLKGQEYTTLGFKFDLKPGQNINADNLQLDKSYFKTDKSFGNVSSIAPNAQTFSDLTPKQKALFHTNVINQYGDYISSVAKASNVKGKAPAFNNEDIQNFKDTLVFGTNENKGLLDYKNLMYGVGTPFAVGVGVNASGYGDEVNKEILNIFENKPITEEGIISGVKEIVQENPITSSALATAAPLATEKGRDIYGKIGKGLLKGLSVAGTPLGVATYEALGPGGLRESIQEGKTTEDIATDPFTYASLPFANIASQAVSNPTLQKILSLGLPARVVGALTPIGLTAIGATTAYRGIKNLKEEIERRSLLTPEQRQQEDVDREIESSRLAETGQFATGGRVGYKNGSDDPESDLYIPPLNRNQKTKAEGIIKITEKRLGPEDSLSKYKSYSEEELLGNIEAKRPNQLQSFSLEDYQLNTMPIFKPKDVAPPKSYSPMPNIYNERREGILELATGGRVGFKDGQKDPNKLIPIDPLLQDQSPTDPGRRDVLKLGIAGAGLLGLGKLGLLKLGSVAKPSIIAEAVKGTTAPSWMEGLMTKILKEGTEIKMPKESSIIKKEVQFKNPETGDVQTATLTIDSKSDRMFIEYDSPTNVAKQPVVLELYRERKAVQNPGGKSFHLAPDETKGYNFYTSEAGPRVTDWDGNIEFDREDTYRKIIELKSDISGLKSYATEGKGIDKKIAKEKRKATADIEKNPEEYVPDWEPEIYD
jgi:hypothetical protein